MKTGSYAGRTLLALAMALSCMNSASTSPCVVVSADADETARFAGAELSGYLEKVCERPFGIRTAPSEGASFVFRLTVADAPVKAADAEDPAAARWRDADSFAITPRPGGVDIVGGSGRGLLFAVYQFLERCAGVRWFHHVEDGVWIPKKTWAELEAAISKAAPFALRPSYGFRMAYYLGRDYVRWAPTAGVNALNFGYGNVTSKDWPETLRLLKQRGIWIVVHSHDTYRRFLSPEKYFVPHPEWSCLKDGKRIGLETLNASATFCVSHPDARRTLIENVVAYLREHPEIDFLYPWPADAAKWCECAPCRAKPVGDSLLDLDNDMAAAIASAGLKTKLIHFAYGTHMEPPQTSRPAPGLIVGFSAWGRDFNFALDDEGTPEHFRKAFVRWSEICRENRTPMLVHAKLLRLYGVGFRLLPYPVTEHDLRYMLAQGVSGLDFHFANTGWRTKVLNTYCVLRLTRNISHSFQALQDRFFEEYYGPHAAAARAVYERATAAMPCVNYWNSPRFNPNLAHTALDAPTVPALYRKTERTRPIAGLRDYDKKAREGVAQCLKTLAARQSAGAPYDARLLELKTMLSYVRDQREAVDAFCAFLEDADFSQVRNADEIQARRERARQSLAAAEAAEDRMAAWLKDEARNKGLLWDNGSCRKKEVAEWKSFGDELAETAARDAELSPRIVFQIGSFYGTFFDENRKRSDLGDPQAHPARAVYRAPADWRQRASWPDFPGRHQEEGAGHAETITVAFDAPAGKYLLTVGHGTTGEPETVPVLVDGREIGRYTTQKEKYSARSDFEVTLDRPGEHTLTLGPCGRNKGYELDAIRLMRAQ